MKLKQFVGISAAVCLLTAPTQAQEAGQVEQLRKQLQQLQQDFERQQQLHRQQMEALKGQLDELQQSQSAVAAGQEQLKANMARTADAVENKLPSFDRSWRPTDPIRLGRGAAYLDIGLVGTFAVGGSTADDLEDLQPGGHDPNQRGFSMQGLEVNLAGAVDPYFRGSANLLFQIDRDGESFLEVEEAWLETMSLPGNLQLRAGQILTEFGRHNPTHVHSWGFVDTPLVNGRLMGADGLRNLGARLSWLMPLPFYSELFLSVQNSHGETASSFRSAGHSHGGEEEEGIPFAFRHPDNDRGMRGFGDLLFTPRYAASFELTDAQTVLMGASAAFGPNSSGDAGQSTHTQIYGVDLTWKWKSPRHSGGFPFVTWTTEGMLRKYRAGMFDWDEDANGGDGDGDGFVDEGTLVDPLTGLPAVLGAETLTDYGFYSQLLYGFRKGWVAGLRFDYVTGERGRYENRGFLVADGAGGGAAIGRDPFRASRWRLSPNLTWYPSEFSKIRLQYNYDDRHLMGADHSVWLQFEFLLGAHAAHKF